MNNQIIKSYKILRKQGEPAKQALCSARIIEQFRQLEREELVSLKAEWEREEYFDVYGVPENPKEQAQIAKEIETYGCWCVSSHFRTEQIDEWEWADSIGMCIYKDPLSPYENSYIIDLMASAMEELKKSQFYNNAIITL